MRVSPRSQYVPFLLQNPDILDQPGHFVRKRAFIDATNSAVGINQEEQLRMQEIVLFDRQAEIFFREIGPQKLKLGSEVSRKNHSNYIHKDEPKRMDEK